MKLYGNVPPEDRILAEQLEETEKWFVDNKEHIAPPMRAMGLTSLAHTWYSMGMDEEGDRILMSVETYAPGYFKKQVFDHVASSEAFSIAYEDLRNNLAPELMDLLSPKA